MHHSLQANRQVTQRNIDYPDDAILVTTTDLNGVITYANRNFIRIAGFSREELLGANHHIVRHPDMPEAAFRDLWEHLKRGESWNQLVKNRARNGDHYWVRAYVTPIYDKGEIIGYQSVCSKPKPGEIEAAERLYRRMRENPDMGIPSRRKGINDYSLKGVILTVSALFMAMQVCFYLLRHFDMVHGFLEVLLHAINIGVPLGFYFFMSAVLKPVQKIQNALHATAKGNLSALVDGISGNEIGKIAEAARSVQASMLVTLGESKQFNNELGKVSSALSESGAMAVTALKEQAEQTDMVAAALNEMSATVQDIARNASVTAESVTDAQSDSKNGMSEISRTQAAINDMAKEMDCTVKSIESLKSKGVAIENVVSLISGIADQTNLLALNAAIEAARAGEHGRGFAVVADEVRSLAAKTQSSTIEIKDMISQLSVEIESAVKTIGTGQVRMNEVRSQADRAHTALTKITDSINQISDMSMQIASATEEQSMVAEEVNRNISVIREKTDQTIGMSYNNLKVGVTVANMATQAEKAMSRFHIGERGGEFVAMKSAHLAWKAKVRVYLDGDESAISGAAATDHHQCMLGKWYDQTGLKEYGNLPGMASLDKPHRDLHATIKMIVDLTRAGKRKEAEALLPEVDRLSDEVVAILDRLDKAV